MAASEDSNHICFSITTNPLDLVECSFEKYTHKKSIPYKEKDVIGKVKCFKENDKRKV